MSLIRTVFSLLWVSLIVAAFNRGGGPLASHIVFTLCVFLAIGAVVLRGRIAGWSSERFSPRFGWIQALYGVFCVLVGASIVFGLTPEYGLSEFLLFVNGGIFVFVLSGLEVEESDLAFFAQGTITITTLITLAGFYFYLTNPIARLAGTFLYPSEPQNAAFNSYANVLLCVIPMAVWYALQDFKKRYQGALAKVACAILIAALVLTFSRAAYLSLFAVGVMFAGLVFVLRKKTNMPSLRLLILRTALVVALSGAIFVGLQTLRANVYNTTSLTDKLLFQSDEGGASARERLDYWGASVRLIGERPLLGAGVLSFRFLYPQYQERFGINEDHPHNILLKIGVENGLIAALLFLLALSCVAFVALRLSLKDPLNLAVITSVGAAAALTHNLIDFNIIVSNYVLLAAAAGLLLSAARKKQSHPSLHAVARAFPYGVFIVSLMLTSLALHEAYYNRDLQTARRLISAQRFEESAPYLERAQRLFFKRDFYSLYSDYARARYVESKDKQWLTDELKHLPAQTVTSWIQADYDERAGVNLMAQSLLNSPPVVHSTLSSPDALLFNQAGIFLCAALRQDPQNDLEYYYNYIEYLTKSPAYTDVLLSKEDLLSAPTNCGARRIDVLLDEYVEVLKSNEHFTILTQNPEFASKLLGLFGSTGQKSEFDEMWLNEKKKYESSFISTPQK